MDIEAKKGISVCLYGIYKRLGKQRRTKADKTYYGVFYCKCSCAAFERYVIIDEVDCTAVYTCH